MKQHITVEQLNELSEEGKKKLVEWFEAKSWFAHSEGPTMMLETFEKSFSDLISIGQMVEFLYEHSNRQLGCVFWNHSNHLPAHDEYDEAIDEATSIETLCDELWDAVKQVLETTDEK